MKALNFVLLRAPLQSLDFAFGELPEELNQMFLEGLRLATPVFYQELQKGQFISESEKKRIKDTLYKYWLRSCTRCTPYGYFAGSTIIDIANDSSIILANNSCSTLVARLDMGYLSMLRVEIEKIEPIQAQLKFRVNDSLYETVSDYRYVEYILNGNIREYKLSSVEKSEYLKFVVNCANRPIKRDILAAKLADFSNVTFAEAKEFVIEIINSQLIISELELTLSGTNPLQGLIEKLKNNDAAYEVVEGLRRISKLLINLNIGEYNDVEKQVLDVFELEGAYKDIIQIDLSLATVENQIDKRITDKIVGQVNDLQSLARLGSNANMEIFKSKFTERYDLAEVPLALVLDSDLGIGYGTEDKSEKNEWIQTIPEVAKPFENGIRHDYITKYIYRKYQDFITNLKQEIEITEEDLNELPKHNYRFAPSSYIFGSLLGHKETQDNVLFHMKGIGRSSAGTIFGRFTLGDEELTKLTKSTMENEEAEYPDAIFAEIIHIPQARVGNLLLRSSLREYEIPYLATAGVKEEFQIPVNDLLVSVRKNEVILKSIRNNRRVFPRLSSAQNFNVGSLPLYKFLCDIQFQGLAQPCVWDWGILKDEKYLPRVRFKNVILENARWVIVEDEIKELLKLERNTLQGAISILRERRGLPKLVSIMQGDNTLLIDFENPQAVLLLIDFLKKYKSVIVEEFLFTKENCMVKDENGASYTNELVIPFLRDFGERAISYEKIKRISIQKKFPPGSEWLYVKVYSGEKTLEKILLNTIFPFVEANKSLFTQFFFIRYTDPGMHLRLRFFNSDLHAQLHLQKEFLEILNPYIASGQVEKVLIDTYVREIERYSEDLIIESESIFHNDSLSILRLNSLLQEVEEPMKYRVILAMRAIDILFNDFGMNLDAKKELTKAMSSNFMQEFGGEAFLKRVVNDKYRRIQREIVSHMDEQYDTHNEINEAVDILKLGSQNNKRVIIEINRKLSQTSEKRIDSLLRDYAHMMMNRLFISQQRKYELIVYSFMERYYSSRQAVLNKNKNANISD